MTAKAEIAVKKIVCTALIVFLGGAAWGLEEVPYGTGTWDAESLGNHRVVVRVDKRGDAAALRIPWRRRDRDPQKKDILILDAATGQFVDNLMRLDINREYGDLIFQPQTVPGDYYIYYMSYFQEGRRNYPTVFYPGPKSTADDQWLKKHGLSSPKSAQKAWKRLPRARCVEFQAIDAFNSFYPMEQIACKDEVVALTAKHKDRAFLLFPEDRAYPIRMSTDLPYRWIKSGAGNAFAGEAARGEFYAFQIGVYAARKDIADLEVTFTDLQAGKPGVSIPASALRCINLGGINWNGEPLQKPCPVSKGKVQALWFGVEVAKDTRPGEYSGTVTVVPRGMAPQSVRLTLTVNEAVLADGGDGEPRRHSRLRWLDSRIAFDNEVTPPFTPMAATRHKENLLVDCLGRRLTLGPSGLPSQIESRFNPEVTAVDPGPGRQILAAPFRLVVESPTQGPLPWRHGGTRLLEQAPGLVSWQSESDTTSGNLHLVCRGRMEFDGFVTIRCELTAKSETTLKDIRLEIPIKKDATKYMMGLNVVGGLRPASHKWKWDVKKNQDAVWIGDVNAGMQVHLRDNRYSRPLNTNFYQSKPLVMPDSWCNGGKGGIDITERKPGVVSVDCYAGERTVKAGQTLHFYFNLLLTPFKPLDPAGHFATRFYHRYDPLDKIKALGANTVNVHHATEINPFINYPFLRTKEMKAYIDEAHQKGLKVKIYNTIRELSNRAPELFALQSLGSEVISPGPGGGFSWLQEHLEGNYIAGWFVPRYRDAAIINSGMSRWHNYYLEGIARLVKTVGIDGLYIDDLAFDRTTMKRLRKILNRGREGALIDLHSANQHNGRDGFSNSANLYMEHFPYIDRLWFGEYFNYALEPDYWLIEVSGIPFGLMGEMLQNGGNPWRGMVYGMTSRLPWAGDPRPLWRVWDDFGIAESRMFGYWSPRCPVKTGRSDVLATAYVIEGKRTLVAVANWYKETVNCNLDVDWKALGLKRHKSRLRAPAIKDFQTAAVFKPGDAIPLEPGKGMLLVIEHQ